MAIPKGRRPTPGWYNAARGRQPPDLAISDGAVSISISMLLSVLLAECQGCANLQPLGYLNRLTARDDGIIIVATLLLFTTSMAFYGGA